MEISPHITGKSGTVLWFAGGTREGWPDLKAYTGNPRVVKRHSELDGATTVFVPLYWFRGSLEERLDLGLGGHVVSQLNKRVPNARVEFLLMQEPTEEQENVPHEELKRIFKRQGFEGTDFDVTVIRYHDGQILEEPGAYVKAARPKGQADFSEAQIISALLMTGANPGAAAELLFKA